jgi:CDP-glucose 4,6-dehydratase
MEDLVTSAGTDPRSRLASWYGGKNVFVTGHTGFKGAWLTALLHSAGARIKGYALAPETDRGLFSFLQPLGIVGHVIADIRDRDRLSGELADFQPDFIFHLAAQALVRRSYAVPAETFDVNVTGTANLLEAVSRLKRPCAVVVITTDKVYENKETGALYREEDRLGGYDPYSASKAAAELVIDSFRNSFFHPGSAGSHRVGLASARAGNVIGGGDWSEDRILPDIVRSLKDHRVIEVRNPHAIRPWQHVLEPLAGYLLLGGHLKENAAAYAKAYNFGPLPEGHLSVADLVKMAINMWGEGNWEDRSSSDAVHEASTLKLDITKARMELGWSPKLDAHAAVQWTLEWYREPDAGVVDLTFRQINTYLSL